MNAAIAKYTKLELVQVNNKLTTHIADLEARLSQTLIMIEIEKTASANLADVASALNRITTNRPRYAQPAWQVERVAQMEATKALAVASKKPVLAKF